MSANELRNDDDDNADDGGGGDGGVDGGDGLTGPWKQVQSAIWLIGLAILAWQGWWWPGILILVAISGLTEAAMKWYAGKQAAETQAKLAHQEAVRERLATLPDSCPNCGSPISTDTVTWTGSSIATCPYCGSAITSAKAADNGSSGRQEAAAKTQN